MNIVAYWLIALMLTANAPARCSISVNPYPVDPRVTYLWGVFTSRVVEAPVGYNLLGEEFGHWSQPDSSATVYGQVIQIRGVGGFRAETVDDRAKRGAAMREAVLVLWDYDAGCDPTPFGTGGEAWGIPGDTVFMVAQLRTPEVWAGGLPTFDVYFAGEGIYPFEATKHGHEYAEYVRANPIPGVRDPERPKALAPGKAFELLQALPRPCDYLTRPRRASIRLHWAMLRWSRLTDYYPVQQTLERHRTLSQGGQWLNERCEETNEMRQQRGA